ncbi:2-amino-3-carboxymuconate-6-semialdehyde decarboxylase isoform X3 [Delphinus delphis]|uniref:2-amino-3-carboxymuconate-6-semialdehyde decarboxylase isoform X3 n=1 Tax=Delphinus delphis TaxID=9728 RepID=UPI0028C4D9D6|nr:2-amino-3-carboxymuconate-6-semialdehyde decarboxylase isoform X3 [Delphinus delphis]
MKIDIHSHILPKEWPDLKKRFGYGGWVQLQHHGKAKPQDTLELCQLLNNDLAATVASHPRRFVGLGTLPMQAPELAVKELQRCVKELGFPGVQIGSHINEWNLNAQELFPVYAEAEKLNCSLFVHPWDMQMDGRMAKYWFPWLIGMPAETTTAICSMIMGGVFEKFPKLKVCFAHGGGSFPYTVGRISHGFSMRPDLCAQDNPTNPKKYLGSFYTDSLVHDPLALKLLTDVVGKDKVILGTDYPFPLGELEPGKLIESMEEFDAETKSRVDERLLVLQPGVSAVPLRWESQFQDTGPQ